MGSQHRSLGLALAVTLLASCAGSGIDTKVASPPEPAAEPAAQEVAADSVVVTGNARSRL